LWELGKLYERLESPHDLLEKEKEIKTEINK
jgi:hypothetical protein